MARRVVVVGAGLAGLTAADRLVAAGVEVTVLEASSRIGGRTFTRRAEFIDGRAAEAGAEWIDTVHRRVHELVDRFGLRVDPATTTWTAVRRWLHRDGVLLGPPQLGESDPGFMDELDRFDAFIAAVAEGITDPGRPDLHPEAARFDAMSVADVMVELGLGALAALFARRNMQGEFAAEPAEVSVLFIAQQRAVYAATQSSHGAVEAQRLLGGVGQLSDALAGALPEGTIRRGHPVHRVDTEDIGVRVQTEADVHEADAVVIACSLPAMRRIVFEPSLPDDLAAAVRGLGYGTVTKTALQYPQRTWPPGYATTSGAVQRVYEPTAGMAGDTGILMAYTGGDGGRELAQLTEHERMAVVEHAQREMYPDLASRVGGFSQSWSAEPLFGGSYAVYRPGEIARFWNVLRRPWGRIHLAGEHTATWTGYLEGAIESGEAVAAALLRAG